MKRFLRPLLMLLVIIAACVILNPIKAQAASTSDLAFALNRDGQSYSVEAKSTSISGALTIPSTYNGKPVTTIGAYAFYGCDSLTGVTIPDGVATIGDSAFSSCSNLTSVTIGNSVITIGIWAFADCKALTSVTIPDSITSIGGAVFMNCTNLTSVIIGDSVVTISADAFRSCKSLKSVTIPNSVTAISRGAFEFCSNLSNVYYTGTQAQWDAIGIESSSNSSLLNATLHLISHCEVYDHTEEVIPGKAPVGCYETGLTEGMKCSVCGEILVAQEAIPANIHTEVIIPGKKATCLKTGLTDGKICSACDAVLQVQEIIPVGDHIAVIIPGEPATCTASGISDGVGCDACGELLVFPEEIPALGHDEQIIPGKAPTCTEAGLTDGKSCTRCGKIYLAQNEIPALGHAEKTVPGKIATCTETGLTEGEKCAICGEIFVAQEVIPATGHTEEIILGKTAACLDTGLTEGKKCTVCGEILVAQKEIPATGHIFDHEFDAICNACGEVRETNGTYDFINYRVVFADNDTTHTNHRAVIYNLGDKTVADPTDENALKAIDPIAETKWGISGINKILLTDAGNYVVLLKYNVGVGAAVKVALEVSVSADPKLIIDKNNKITAIDNNEANINHRVVVYYLGGQTVEDIYDVAALEAIDSEPETIWKLKYINRLALTKGGNYVLHLCYNEGISAKLTVAQQFTVYSIPSVSVNNNNMLVATEENPENRNHRATVFYLGENEVEDSFDEEEVKAAAVSYKTYWGLPAINKAEILKGGNYVIHLYYNVGTSDKRTLALDLTLNERPVVSVDANGKISVSYTDPAINTPRAYIYNVGDAAVDNIYDEAALKKIATPTQVWGIEKINKKTLTPGTYVIHFYYSVDVSAKKTVAIKATI